MDQLVFANPSWFWLFIGWFLLIVWYLFRHRSLTPYVRVSSLESFQAAGTTLRTRMRHILFICRMMAMAAGIVLLARPQKANQWQSIDTEGIDIMLTLDISGSMLARDFQPDRLEAAKEVATQFIAGRENDRIGMVVFSGESFTQCPLTSDHAVLINLMQGIKSGMINDGTAIGLGLANAVDRIRESSAKSKVIILLTDGVNNAGSIDPVTAAEIAKTFNIRVYTIGVGTEGTAPYPVQTPFGIQMQPMEVQIDEAVLQQVASLTGGSYFRATDNEKLQEIYAEIDKMEKSIVSVREHKKKEELYFPFAMALVVLLMCEIGFRYTWLRTIP